MCAALALTRSGREVTLLDCAVPPIDKVCGEGLMPDSLALLESLGVHLPESGMHMQGISFFSESTCVAADFPNGPGRGVRRLALHEALVTRAEQLGIRLLWGVKNVRTLPGKVSFNGGQIKTKLIVGADGLNSSVRRDAGLDSFTTNKRRFGFRRHYRVTPWSPYVEVYWGPNFQIYVTPIASDQVGVALVSSNPRLRLDAALPLIPALFGHLRDAASVTAEQGSPTGTRTLRRVSNDDYVLLGDASGSVDAITGEGLCLAFKQSAALVVALDAGDLRQYQQNHQKINAGARRMASVLLMLDSHPTLRRKALEALSAHPAIFSTLLSAHVGHKPLAAVFSWQLVSFGLGVLCA